jgi:hypothetical protein
MLLADLTANIPSLAHGKTTESLRMTGGVEDSDDTALAFTRCIEVSCPKVVKATRGQKTLDLLRVTIVKKATIKEKRHSAKSIPQTRA